MMVDEHKSPPKHRCNGQLLVLGAWNDDPLRTGHFELVICLVDLDFVSRAIAMLWFSVLPML